MAHSMKRLLALLLLACSPAFAVEITISENTGADYTGVTDTEIHENGSEQGTNYSTETSLEPSSFSSSNRRHALYNFTSPSLGTVTVSTACLRLYNTVNGGGTINFAVHATLQAAVASQATWNDYATSTAWASAGALASGTDYTPLVTGVAVNSTDSEYKDFCGSGLASWAETHLNLGTPIRVMVWRDPDDAYDSNYRVFASSEGSDGQRPELVINYTLASGADPVMTLHQPDKGIGPHRSQQLGGLLQ